MIEQSKHSSIQKAARIAGGAYIVIILLGVLKAMFLDAKLIIPGNNAATAQNLLVGESLFRLGFVSDLILYALVLILALSLFVILKPVNGNLASAALLFRVTEGIIGLVVTLYTGLIPLMILNGETGMETEQSHALIGLFLSLSAGGLDVVLLFVGLGGMIFCYLFYLSNYVPRVLAAWGILTYLSMVFIGLMNILVPDCPQIIETVLFGVGGSFEMLFGFWLLLKGVNIPKTVA